ncbi:DEAD/DEAH box helicase [Paenibacillus sp. TRM 82003]|nr:DEAD/DEAH box helicase [Paenibacillus sp. TRM 82003]
MNETFASLGLTGPWGERLAARGIERPAPIQIAAVPTLLTGGDAVIRSRTGTGKTLAYLLPVLERLDPASDKLQAVVLAPTAELAMQIAKEAADLTEGTPLRALALIGGASLQRQLDKLKTRPQLVVGTPGRILELLSLKKLKTGDVRAVVVDEADQTFALGAGGEAEKLLGALAGRTQTIFCSATMPEEAKAVVARCTKDLAWLEVEPEGTEAGGRLPSAVEHVVVATEERDKIDTVRRLLRTVTPRAAILFVNQTESIAEVEAKLQYHGLAVEAIYGDQPKQERTAVMRRFRNGKLKLLLATDVAARGLDAPDVTHVIHVDPPYDAERYLHRAGRTGRMGRAGMSILVLPPNRAFVAKKFEEQLGVSFREMKLAGGELKQRQARPEGEAPREKRMPATLASKPVSREANAAGKSAAKPAAAAPEKKAAPAAAKPPIKASVKAALQKKAARKRDQKNKGAPKWLKEKRDNGGEPNV